MRSAGGAALNVGSRVPPRAGADARGLQTAAAPASSGQTQTAWAPTGRTPPREVTRPTGAPLFALWADLRAGALEGELRGCLNLAVAERQARGRCQWAHTVERRRRRRDCMAGSAGKRGRVPPGQVQGFCCPNSTSARVLHVLKQFGFPRRASTPLRPMTAFTTPRAPQACSGWAASNHPEPG